MPAPVTWCCVSPVTTNATSKPWRACAAISAGNAGKLPARVPHQILHAFSRSGGPFDAVFSRPSRIICGHLNVTRSVQKPVRNPVQNRSRKPVVRADVRRRRIWCFWSRSSLSRAWSGPCRGAALSEELWGQAGGSAHALPPAYRNFLSFPAEPVKLSKKNLPTSAASIHPCRPGCVPPSGCRRRPWPRPGTPWRPPWRQRGRRARK